MMYVTPTVAKRSMGSFQNTVRAKDAKPCSDLVIECPVTTRAVLDFSPVISVRTTQTTGHGKVVDISGTGGS
ncbi:hypothetical protein P692DRAFT_20830833 [Suillus brevipes Sb2]|nr:hypothetical protein P692DRAFT_20830833 [Suillus brevipes Sb2]